MELLNMLAGNAVFAEIVGFLVLFFVLRTFAWKGLLAVLDQRKARIASELESIETSKKDIEALKHDYAVKLGTADEAARAKVQEAVNEARKAADDIRKAAREDAKEMLERERINIVQEIAKSKEDLKNQMVDIVMEVVEKVVEEKLTTDPGNDKKMVQEFLAKMDKTL
jgi:F-type H+-transporting ATPase subunit b